MRAEDSTMGFEEAKTDFYPEKYGEYFASMSPLASKIYWDVQSTIKQNHTHLSYSEKCVVVDKKLIYDPIHFPKDSVGHHDDSHETHVFYDDPVLDQDHVSALLLNVHPKKSDKYVYDENSQWVDEHAVPYSSCTEAQAKACNLAHLLNKIQFSTDARPVVSSTKKYKAPSRPSLPVKKDVDEEQLKKDERILIDETADDEEQQKKGERMLIHETHDQEERGLIKKPEGIIGVSVMGLASSPPKLQKSKGTTEDRSKARQQEVDNLPQQVQNQDLIAELQAKLKKNRGGSNAQPAVTSSSSPKPSSSSTSKSLHKLKAPPPPPPVVTKEPEVKLNTRKTTTEDEFIVDVSSPCKIATPKTGFDFLDNW